MKNVLGLITARGGSKGIPGKNIRSLAGKPLIAWTIEAAQKSGCLARIAVSTDDEAIAAVARDWGAEVPFMRPVKLAEDTSSHISVVEHALNWFLEHENYTPDYLLLLQPTSPLRVPEDIQAAVELAEARDAVGVVSVVESHPHPYLSKRIQPDGALADLITVENIPYLRRQDLPLVYSLNGAIYLGRPGALLKERTFMPKGTLAYIMPPERSLDVDTPWDLYMIDLILKDRMNSVDKTSNIEH